MSVNNKDDKDKNSEKEVFKMTYSAKERDEIEKIRQKYSTRKPDKMEQLRMLDASTSKKALTVFLVLAICGALILGLGMSFAMTDLGDTLQLDEVQSTVIGIAIGLVGIILGVLSYPISNKVLKHERQKIAPEILRLTDELIK